MKEPGELSDVSLNDQMLYLYRSCLLLSQQDSTESLSSMLYVEITYFYVTNHTLTFHPTAALSF